MLVESTPGCMATPRILFALEEMGIPYEFVIKPDGYFMEQFTVVGPSLVEGEFRLFEGNPIMRHIGRKHSFGKLMPSNLEGQAEVDRWLDFLVLRIGMSLI